MTDAKHEAPAEGAGEVEHVAKWHEDRAAFLTSKAADDEWSETEAQMHRDMASSLRARSSAPEAREGTQPHCQLCGGTVEGWFCQTCEASFEEVDGLLVLKSEATQPAAPSTDKLRAGLDEIERLVNQSGAIPKGELRSILSALKAEGC